MPKKLSRARAEAALKAAVRKNAHLMLDNFLNAPETQTKMPLIEVIAAHCAVGYGFTVSIHLQHPKAPGRAEEAKEVTEALAQPKPVIELVGG